MFYKSNSPDRTARAATPFSITLCAGAPFLGTVVGVDPPEVVWLPADEGAEMPVDEAAVVGLEEPAVVVPADEAEVIPVDEGAEVEEAPPMIWNRRRA